MWGTLFAVLARHALSGVGGAIVANGVASASQSEAIVGGAVALAGVVQSLYSKWKNKAPTLAK